MGFISLSTTRIAIGRSFYPKHQGSTLVIKRQKSTATGNGSTTIENVKTTPTPNIIPAAPLWQRLGPLSTAFNAYGRSQQRNPLTTQLCSSVMIYFCGDLSAQYIQGDDYDPWRTARNLVIGAVSSIPSYKWFIYLGQSFNYSSKALSLSVKVIVNQIVFTPIFNSYFFGMQSLLSGDGFTEAWGRIKRTVPISAINSCKLWPVVTAFNFTYIDPQYRALFAGFVAIGWQTYLSWLNQLAAMEELARKGASEKATETITPDTSSLSPTEKE